MKYHYYKTMPKTFRENLRDELDYQDMKVKELSVATGIPKPTLDCYLSARQVIPPADIAVKIAKVLNVSVEYLVTGESAAAQSAKAKENGWNAHSGKLSFMNLPECPQFFLGNV